VRYRNAPDQLIEASHYRSLGAYSGHLSEFHERLSPASFFTEVHLEVKI
jgi:hypothetical protein